MVIIYAILFIYALSWVLEVFHDDVQRLERNMGRGLMSMLEKADPNYFKKEDQKQSEKWSTEAHAYDFARHALIALMVGAIVFYFTKNWTVFLLPISVALLRMLILNIGGNFKSGNKNKLHLGKGPIDTWLKNSFGNWWPIFVTTLLLATISIQIWL